MKKTPILSIDVTPNGKCFEIETPAESGALRSTIYNVVPFHTIENDVYEMSEANVTSAALTVLVEMNSRHLA
jgi:hypothetical protein